MLKRFFHRRPVVIVVCTANICRSPVAAASLRAELAGLGVPRLCRVLSAGTRVGSPGQLPDPRMRDMAKRVGVSLRGERARVLTRSLADSARLIVVMEERHREEVRVILESSESTVPTRRLGDWLDEPPADGDIADPYFSNAAALELVFEQIRAACSNLALDMTRNQGNFFS